MIPTDYYKPLIYGYLTLFVIAIIGELLHFFIPISLPLSLILIGISLVGFFLIIKQELTPAIALGYLIILSTILLLVPFFWYRYYDTGLYHLQAMRWIVEYPVQFGLANVHYRLGYNSIWFTLESIVDQHVLWANTPYFLLNGIVLAIYSFPLVKLVRNRAYDTRDIFYLLTLVPAIGFAGIFLTSASPDLFVMLLTFTVMGLLIQEYETPDESVVFSALLLSAFAGMVKISMLLLFGMVLAIYLYRYGARRVVVIPILVLVPWLINGIITSGYLIYPFSFTRLPVSWAVPASIAIKDATDIVVWARASPYLVPVLIEFGLLCSLAIIFYALDKKNPFRKETIIPFVVALTGMIAWLITAPEPRYGLGFILSVPLLILAAEFKDQYKNGIVYISLLITIAIAQSIFIYLFYLHTNIPFAFPNPVGDQIWNGGLQ